MSKDKQFRGFAKALLADIDKATDDFCKDKDNQYTDEYEEKIVTLVAQWAYDFATHIYYHACFDHVKFAVENTPDMTELPEEEEI